MRTYFFPVEKKRKALLFVCPWRAKRGLTNIFVPDVINLTVARACASLESPPLLHARHRQQNFFNAYFTLANESKTKHRIFLSVTASGQQVKTKLESDIFVCTIKFMRAEKTNIARTRCWHFQLATHTLHALSSPFICFRWPAVHE